MASGVQILRERFGEQSFRVSEAMAAGVGRTTLYRLREAGELVAVGRGVVQLSGFGTIWHQRRRRPPLGRPDFLWARRVSNLRPLACEASALPLSYAPFALQMPPFCLRDTQVLPKLKTKVRPSSGSSG